MCKIYLPIAWKCKCSIIKTKTKKKKERSEWGCDSEQEWEEECVGQGGRREAVYGPPPFFFSFFCISRIYAIIYMDNMNWRRCVQKLTNLLQSHDTGFGLASPCNWPPLPYPLNNRPPFCQWWFIFYFCIYEWCNNTCLSILCQLVYFLLLYLWMIQ